MKIFGSSILDQALLSAANFMVGLILIRHAGNAEYGYYILVFNTIMLLTMLQNSFMGTPLVIHLPSLGAQERKDWLGGLLKDQNRLLFLILIGALVVLAALGGTQTIDQASLILSAAGLLAVLFSVHREFFRNTLIIFQNPQAVLRSDALYVLVLVPGTIVAVQFSSAATISVLCIALAAGLCGYGMQRSMRSQINPHAPAGRLMDTAAIGLWASAGTAVYWLLNQGYSFVTAYTLDIAAVGALAAARLLMMPMNLLSTGIQKQLSPLASHWLHTLNQRTVFMRLLRVALVLGLCAMVYSLVVWQFRDWIFLDLMRKDHPQKDLFVVLWSLIFIVKILRDPPMLVLVLKKRFKILTSSSGASAVISLLLCYYLTIEYGPAGALWGILVGETFSLLVVLAYAHWLSREKPHRT